ncbi:hypothetical protein L218DRAFT_244501 [Marasmius fiardii PR-910]|nr:hypothetical protein L218DRAFT_244501 [Marasmius fiardii PR-910]
MLISSSCDVIRSGLCVAQVYLYNGLGIFWSWLAPFSKYHSNKDLWDSDSKNLAWFASQPESSDDSSTSFMGAAAEKERGNISITSRTLRSQSTLISTSPAHPTHPRNSKFLESLASIYSESTLFSIRISRSSDEHAIMIMKAVLPPGY